MNKKGFTLIELLAVIVILGIIMIVAIPAIDRYIKKSKIDTSEKSAAGYIDAVNKEGIDKETQLDDGTYSIFDNDVLKNIKIKGTYPTKGTVEIKDTLVVNAKLCVNGYSVLYDGVIYKNQTTADYCLDILPPSYEDFTLTGRDLTFTIKDDVKLLGYAINNESTTPDNWIPLNTREFTTTYVATLGGTYYLHIKDINNTSYRSFFVSNEDACQFDVGKTWEFSATGSQELFDMPCTANYKIEAWGAQGYTVSPYIGGYGAYATGVSNIATGEKLYISVGKVGVGGKTINTPFNSFPNGGKGIVADGVSYVGSGGGATFISFDGQEITTFNTTYQNKLLILASGGGSATYTTGGGWAGHGGAGGGITGKPGTSTGFLVGGGATQTSGGSAGNGCRAGIFGKGGEAPLNGNGTGGGGGLYGGGCSWGGGAGGGSSYIGNMRLITLDSNVKHMTCISCTTSIVDATRTSSTTTSNIIPTTDTPKLGDGYLKITLISF